MRQPRRQLFSRVLHGYSPETPYFLSTRHAPHEDESRSNTATCRWWLIHFSTSAVAKLAPKGPPVPHALMSRIAECRRDARVPQGLRITVGSEQSVRFGIGGWFRVALDHPHICWARIGADQIPSASQPPVHRHAGDAVVLETWFSLEGLSIGGSGFDVSSCIDARRWHVGRCIV